MRDPKRLVLDLPIAAAASTSVAVASTTASTPGAPPSAGFWGRLLDTEDFPERWHCGAWTPAHGNLHIASDLLIFGAYMAIPIVLVLLLRKRKDLPFPGILWLFVTFILACGLTHLFEAAMFWWPAYRSMGLVKGATAAVSWATVAALVPSVPKVLALRNPHQAHLAALVASAHEAILSVELDGRVSTWNQAAVEIFGYEADEAIGEPLSRFLDIDDSRLQEPGRDEFQTTGHTREGGTLHLVASTSRIRAATDEVVGTSVIVHDLTQQKRDQQQLVERTLELERSNRDLDQFAYVASHDLKAPLRAISQLASWLEEDLGDSISGESREHLTLLQRRSQRMEALLDSLLDYARADKNLAIEPIDFKLLVEECVSFVLVPDAYEVVVQAHIPTFEGHRFALQQVMTNLIQNAVKHHDKPSGTITVRAMVRADRLLVSISDDGPGIDPQFQGRIFKLFQTLRPRDEVEGSGVGLALVKKLVERFGGSIVVESSLGRGATFTFDWPIRPVAIEDATTESTVLRAVPNEPQRSTP